MRAARRELRMRERVYPSRVALGRMPASRADHEIACMQGIIGVLKERLRSEHAQMELKL